MRKARMSDAVPHDLQPPVRDLLLRCLAEDPSARPSFAEVGGAWCDVV